MNQPPSESATPSAVPSFNPQLTNLCAGLSYLAIVAVLFHRLSFGEVLSPAANLWRDVPFRGELKEDVSPYVNGIQGDVWRAIEPWHIYQYRAAREGRFPLWNPHSFCGFSFHGNGQSAMLSPFHWVYFVVDPKWAAGPVAALKLFCAGLATYWLGRRLGLSASGAFLSGAAFMLCAFNVRWLLWPLSSAAVWMPVLLIALDRLIERVSWRNFAVAGLAATVLQVTGHPETQFHVGALSGLFVLIRVMLLGESPFVRTGRVFACLAAHVVGVAGAAVSLWPFAEQLVASADWREPTRLIGRFLPPEGLLGAIAPDHFGRPRGGRWYQGPSNYIEAGLYVGLMPLSLAVVALARLLFQPRWTRSRPAGEAIVIFGVWLLLCVVIVLGLPIVSVVVDRLPLLSKADNLRLLLGVQFAGAMLAGAAWTQLNDEPSRLGTWALFVAVTAIAISLGVLLIVPGPAGLYSHRDGLFQLWTDPTVPAPVEHRSLRTLVSFLLAVASVCWLWLWRRWWRRRVTPPGGAPVQARTGPWIWRSLFGSHAVASLLLLTLGDLIWVAYGFNPTVPPRVVFPELPARFRKLTETVAGGRIAATGEILSPNLGIVYGFHDLRGYDFPLDVYWAKLFQRLHWNPGMPLVPDHQASPCLYPAIQSLCDKCCVRLFVTDWGGQGKTPPAELSPCADAGHGEHPSWPLIERGLGASEDAVYENPSAYPRAYFAERVSEAAAEASLDAVLDLSHDFRNVSFVTEPIDGLGVAASSQPAGEATIEHDGAEEVQIRARSSAAALLVLSDRCDAGWRVEIDGRPARALRANSLFRGVIVPAGEHLVRWSYRPASFVWGRRVSFATLVALAIMILIRRKQPPRVAQAP